MTLPDTISAHWFSHNVAYEAGYKPAEQPTLPPSLPPLWRVLHDVETAKGNWREGMPEVHRLVPDHRVTLTFTRQWLWKNLNLNMTGLKWAKLLGNKLAFTNGSGFPGHADLVNEIDVDMALPYFDIARICGGAVVTGQVIGDYLYIQTIDTRKPLPSVEYIMARRWLFFDATLAGKTIGKFPQGDGKPVYVPLLSAADGVKLPMWKLERWTGSTLPDPYTIYT